MRMKTVELFHTPDSLHGAKLYHDKVVNSLDPAARIGVTTSHYMLWNAIAKQANKDADEVEGLLNRCLDVIEGGNDCYDSILVQDVLAYLNKEG